MTNSEFSNQFDVLYNNIMSNQAPGLDEYEKSVFLTKAQTEIVLSYFNPKSNKVLQGFDGSEARQIDFSMLMKSADCHTGEATFDPRTNGTASVSLPSDILLIINEFVIVGGTANTNSNAGTPSADSDADDSAGSGSNSESTPASTSGGTPLIVVPINYLEYSRLMSKPFKRPTHYQAWRLMVSTEAGTGNDADSDQGGDSEQGSEGNTSKVSVCDLIAGPNDTITGYKIRYVRRPAPIVLGNFTSDGLSIGNTSTNSECELDPILHEDILQRAVELAKAAYTGDLNAQVALGVNSGTEKGIVSGGGR